MSYDLVVFEPAAAPADRDGFLAWYTEAARLGDGLLACNPAATAPVLQAWYRDMIKAFPALIGPDAPAVREIDDERSAEYRFAPTAIFASFQWEASRKVQLQALRFARSHGVGLFDACGPTCAVWGPTDKGYYGVIHRSDASPDDEPPPLRGPASQFPNAAKRA